MNNSTLSISDSDIEHFTSFDSFYPSPKLSQHYCREIYSKIFTANYEFYDLKGLFLTTINRFLLIDIKFLEHPLIIKNIVEHCLENNITTISFKLHHRNSNLGKYYIQCLEKSGIKALSEYHEKDEFWINSLTTTSSKSAIKHNVKFVAIAIAQFFILCFNRLFVRTPTFSKKLLVWHGFANNRTKVDYPLLDRLSAREDLDVVYPDPYALKSKLTWGRSIYLFGKYSIGPIRYLKSVMQLWFFRNKINALLADFNDIVPEFPRAWNGDVINKTKSFLLFNLLSGALVENLARYNRSESTINVFRGGAIAGLVYSGQVKKKYNNQKMTNLLATHGTEFNVIDHFSYFFLDYNILPSVKICQNWINQLKDYPAISRYDHCNYVAGGRIDYEILDKLVVKDNAKDPKKIGIVLTYSTLYYQNIFLKDIIECFTAKFPDTKLQFLIKPRPNIKFSTSTAIEGMENVKVFQDDVFSFFNEIDLIIGTVSTYGVLSMVVTDGIYCDIPAIYYMPNSKYGGSNLGYSYHPSMDSYTFNSMDNLSNYLDKGERNFKKLLENVKDNNSESKEYLTFDGSPSEYLINLIDNS